MPINSKRKGNRGELQVVRLFQRWWPIAQRSGFMQSSDDCHLPDVMGTPFYIEVKFYKQNLPHSLRRIYQQAYRDMQIWRDDESGHDAIVLVVWRINRQEWQVGIKLSDLRHMAKWKQQVGDAGHIVSVPWWIFQEVVDQWRTQSS